MAAPRQLQLGGVVIRLDLGVVDHGLLQLEQVGQQSLEQLVQARLVLGVEEHGFRLLIQGRLGLGLDGEQVMVWRVGWRTLVGY